MPITSVALAVTFANKSVVCWVNGLFGITDLLSWFYFELTVHSYFELIVHPRWIARKPHAIFIKYFRSKECVKWSREQIFQNIFETHSWNS